MKLRFRAIAVRDLDGVFDYSLATHGAEVAARYLRDLNAAMAGLLEYPEMGATMLARTAVRSIAAREHRIFYRIERRDIVIVRVLHKSMDAERRLG